MKSNTKRERDGKRTSLQGRESRKKEPKGGLETEEEQRRAKSKCAGTEEKKTEGRKEE